MLPQTGKTDHFVPATLYPNGKGTNYLWSVELTILTHTHTHSTVYIYF